MNKLELKSTQLDALSSAYDAIKSHQKYYLSHKVDEDGNYVRDEEGCYIYEIPEDENDLAKYKAIESLLNDFQNWAMKY